MFSLELLENIKILKHNSFLFIEIKMKFFRKLYTKAFVAQRTHKVFKYL